jgi:hypothetical protein
LHPEFWAITSGPRYPWYITPTTVVTRPPSSNTNRQKLVSEYLRLRAIPDDEIKTRRLVRWAKVYLIHDGELYLRSTLGILQRCILVEEGKALLLDVNKGICGLHASSRSMVGNAFRQGFY